MQPQSSKHGRTCAEGWRSRGRAEQWSLDRIAAEIRDCCAVSRLRSHRLARGWNIARATDELRELGAALDVDVRMDPEALRRYETGLLKAPRAQTVALLCRLYDASMDELGLGRGETPMTATVSADRMLDSLDTRLDDVRRSLDRTLAKGTVSGEQLDLLEERLIWLRQRYVSTAPATMLDLLIHELHEVRELAAERQPALAQSRLSEMTAYLATLTADAFMKLGRVQRAGAWYATARAAADDSGSQEVRARVRAQAAMLPYYYGPLDAAARLAREAQLLSSRPSPTSALAAAAQARASARCGDAAGARAAIAAARHDFDRAAGPETDDAFGFPRRRLLLYLSGAYTHLGMSREAYAVQDEALGLYQSHPGSIDPALLAFERAICMVRQRALEEAVHLVRSAYLGVPEEHRTAILGSRARSIIDALPPAQRSTRAIRSLREVLALPVGAT
ncbi:hypothetical protein [Streptomyces sp. RFCAC02]|uniref:hypothetical protein n=1 Tax=Streptomyces sp. RFCAC02 TaxID=2499143 RepID=UPI001021077F|nr:hypothetical protein [Streptomyces sp. RFCAC02]